jgi:hypothetical protein
MTKVWNTVIVGGLLLIATSVIVLRRGEITTSPLVQLIVFLILGSILLVLGGIMRYVQRDETDAPDISTAPYAIGLLGIGACLAGLYWSTASVEGWARFTKLPVTALADVEKEPVGAMVRLEGVAEHNPPIQSGDGSPLALQRVEFSHQDRTITQKARRTISDYAGVRPKEFVIWDASHKDGATILASDMNPEFCILPRVYTRLNGEKEEVEKRAANAVSPEFTDYQYVRGETSGVSVLSLPQSTAVTVCGIIDPPVAGVHPIRATSIATLTGEQFTLRGRNITVATRAIAVMWWAIGIAILFATVLAVRIYRRT